MRAFPSRLVPLCIFYFIFKFLLPLPTPGAKSKIALEFSGEGWGWRWWQTEFHSGGGWRGTRNVLFRDNPTFVSLLIPIYAGVGNAYFRPQSDIPGRLTNGNYAA